MQSFMTYNQDEGMKAGGGTGITDGGAHICKITSAVYAKANTGSHAIEFEIENQEGLKGRYIKVYYAKADGAQISGGQSVLNAIMGLTGIQSLSFSPVNRNDENLNIVPELEGKEVGLFLQKKLYTSGQGNDGYSFEIKAPFDPRTSQTLREKVEQKEAKVIERLSNSYADKDERKAPSGVHGGPQVEGVSEYDGMGGPL